MSTTNRVHFLLVAFLAVGITTGITGQSASVAQAEGTAPTSTPIITAPTSEPAFFPELDPAEAPEAIAQDTNAIVPAAATSRRVVIPLVMLNTANNTAPQPTPQPAPGGNTEAIQPSNYWEKKLLTEYWAVSTDVGRDLEQISKSGDSTRYYHLGPSIDGLTSMYLATGNRQYLDRALYYIQNTVASAKPSSTIANSSFKDSYLGWPSIGRGGNEIPLDESHYWRYVTRLLLVIRRTPELYNTASYRNQYDSLLAFSEKNIFEKWWKRGEGNIYRNRTHMASHWAFISMELAQLTSDSAKRNQYTQIYTKINSDLRNQVRRATWKDSSAYWWDDEWGKYNRPGQDTAHGGDTVAYMVEAYGEKNFWTADDMRGLSAMLLKVIWNGTLSSPKFANSFDGSTSADKYGSTNSGSCQEEGLLKLGRYDAKVQEVYQHYSPRGCYPYQYYGNAALNAKLLTGK